MLQTAQIIGLVYNTKMSTTALSYFLKENKGYNQPIHI
jgi:hypothetical protein